MKRVTLSIAGLATDPNPIMSGAQGALRRADNAIVLANGVLASRPRVSRDPLNTITSDFEARALRYFDGVVHVVGYDSGDDEWQFESSSGVIATEHEAEPPDYDGSPTQFAESRRNLYYTTISGVRKITDGGGLSVGSLLITQSGDLLITQSGDTIQTSQFVAAEGSRSHRAGLDMLLAVPYSVAGTGTGDLLGICGYRLVYRRTDSNGYVRRSAPSYPIPGSASADEYLQWSDFFRYVYIPSWVVVGDVIEIYRTRMSGNLNVNPAPEYFLANEHAITETDVTNGYAVLPDDYKVDDTLGAALYTNSSQGGVVSAKYSPPRAVCLAEWNRCMWFGNTREPHRLEVTINDANTTTGTGIGNYGTLNAATYTSGSPNVTNIPDITGMVIGQAVSDNGRPVEGGTYVPPGTYVTAISGAGPYTVTMSQNALSSGSGQRFEAHDIITVGGVEFYAGSLGWVPDAPFPAERTFYTQTIGDDYNNIRNMAWGIANSVNIYAARNSTYGVPGYFPYRATNLADFFAPDGSVAPGALIFEEIDTLGINSPLTFESTTKPLAVVPTTADGAISSTADERPARLFWSDPDEPEAVPLGQFVDIGNARDPILQLVPLASALLVFKTDGVFRVTGSPPDAWSVELVDSSIRILRGGCADVVRGQAYALCESGVEVVDETGARSATDGVISRELREFTKFLTEDRATPGCFVAGWESAKGVLVGVPGAVNSYYTARLYYYSIIANAWTRWSLVSMCASGAGNSGRLFLAKPGGSGYQQTDRGLVETAFRGYDEANALSGWTYSATGPTVTLTFAQSSTWAPDVGDWISGTTGAGDPQYRRVTSVQESEGNYILTLSAPFDTAPDGNRTGYDAIVTDVQWQAHIAGTPFETALYREIQAALDLSGVSQSVDADVRLELGGNSDATGSESMVAVDVPRAASGTHPMSEPARAMVPREIARASHIYPTLKLGNIECPWRCLGLALVLEPVSERTKR